MRETVTFPPDILAAAEAVIDRGYNEGLVEALCRALAAERERCANIAEGTWAATMDDGAACAAQSIAAAIRGTDAP